MRAPLKQIVKRLRAGAISESKKSVDMDSSESIIRAPLNADA